MFSRNFAIWQQRRHLFLFWPGKGRWRGGPKLGGLMDSPGNSGHIIISTHKILMHKSYLHSPNDLGIGWYTVNPKTIEWFHVLEVLAIFQGLHVASMWPQWGVAFLDGHSTLATLIWTSLGRHWETAKKP